MNGPTHAACEESLVEEYVGNKVADSHFNIISWNVNGIRALLGKGSPVQELATRENPQVICFQETKIDASKTDKVPSLAKGYTMHWNCCSVKNGYSGTAMLIRDDVKGVKVTTDDLGGNFNDEGRIQCAHFKDFVLINTYVPNAGAKLERLDYRCDEWNKALLTYMKKLKKSGKNVIWTGDLNVAHTEIDLKNPKTNTKSAGFTPQERAGFTETLEAGFVDSFRASHPDAMYYYSFWGYRTKGRVTNTGWRLDYFVVNSEFADKIAASSILPAYGGSDHCPIQCLVEA